MAHIYCVKLRQQKHGGSRRRNRGPFPYDRVYLIPPPNPQAIAPKLFKYSLIMPLTRALITQLTAVDYAQTRNISLARKNSELEWTKPGDNSFPKLTTSWLMVIPTFFYTNRELGLPDETLLSGEMRLAYSLSRAVGCSDNLDLRPPTIMLHTPRRNIPFMCAVCKHIADYHAGNCTPLRDQCRNQLQLFLPDVWAEKRQEDETCTTDSNRTVSNA